MPRSAAMKDALPNLFPCFWDSVGKERDLEVGSQKHSQMQGRGNVNMPWLASVIAPETEKVTTI